MALCRRFHPVPAAQHTTTSMRLVRAKWYPPKPLVAGRQSRGTFSDAATLPIWFHRGVIIRIAAGSSARCTWVGMASRLHIDTAVPDTCSVALADGCLLSPPAGHVSAWDPLPPLCPLMVAMRSHLACSVALSPCHRFASCSTGGRWLLALGRGAICETNINARSDGEITRVWTGMPMYHVAPVFFRKCHEKF